MMGLDDPTAKMSKSFAHVRGHAIRMLDDPAEIERSFKRAVTDSGNEIRFSDDPEKAGVNNLLGIYRVATGKDAAEVEADFMNARGYGELKARVAEAVIEELAPIKVRYTELMSDPDEYSTRSSKLRSSVPAKLAAKMPRPAMRISNSARRA